jgi:hypothetical protein
MRIRIRLLPTICVIHIVYARPFIDTPGQARHLAVARELRARQPGARSKFERRVSLRNARIRKPLPVFELVYGQPAEYALGRALEDSVQVRGGPLGAWPYDVQPDLSSFSWMSYERYVVLIIAYNVYADPLAEPGRFSAGHLLRSNRLLFQPTRSRIWMSMYLLGETERTHFGQLLGSRFGLETRLLLWTLRLRRPLCREPHSTRPPRLLPQSCSPMGPYSRY